jgi:glucose/arabinose dehydrogenase
MRWLSYAGAAVAAGLAQLAMAAAARAEVFDARFSETVLLAPNGQAGTTVMTWAPDGSNRLFFARQLGQLRMVSDGALKVVGGVAPVYNEAECGLLGLAFDPRFLDNHYLYLFVTVSPAEQQIVRYVLEGNSITDKTVVVAGLPTRGLGHNAGSIGFGPDGKLYWSIGDLDQTAVDVASDLSTLAGKVARVDLDGRAPADNPFVDGDGSNDDRIWARGFRNPFTFTWQPGTGRLWVNTVGGRGYEQIFAPVGGDHAGWSGYENDQPSGYLSPILAYPGQSVVLLLAPDGANRQSGVATFTTQNPHGMHLGNRVTIAGVTDASFDGQAFVSAVDSANAFSIEQAGPDAVSTGGTAEPIDVGNAITGGTFWDSSSVPLDYRGNFFFGDYASGQIARVTFGADGQIASFDAWGKAPGSMIDMAVGPDGDLYYATFQGGFYRVRYNATEPGIVVSSLHVQVPEASQALFSVRLAVAPDEAVTVNVERTAGDADVLVEPSELTFDASNWSVPQAVRVSAAADDDGAEDTAELTLGAAGAASEVVQVRVTDDDPLAVVVSPAAVSLPAESSVDVSVALNGSPTRAVAVAVAVEAGSLLSPSPSTLTFEPGNWSTPRTVTLTEHGSAPFPVMETVTFTGQALLSTELVATIVKAREDGVGGAFPEGGAPDQRAAAGAGGRGGDGGAAGAGSAGGAEGVSAEGGAMGAGAEPGFQGGVSSRDDGRSGAESDCGCRVARPAPLSPVLAAAFGSLASLLARRARRRRSRFTTAPRRAAAQAHRG